MKVESIYTARDGRTFTGKDGYEQCRQYEEELEKQAKEASGWAAKVAAANKIVAELPRRFDIVPPSCANDTDGYTDFNWYKVETDRELKAVLVAWCDDNEIGYDPEETANMLIQEYDGMFKSKWICPIAYECSDPYIIFLDNELADMRAFEKEFDDTEIPTAAAI